MPRVPPTTGPSVAEQPLQGGFQRSSASPGMFAGPGQQLQALGNAASGLGQELARMQEKDRIEQATTLAKEADIQFTQQVSALQYDPTNGFMSRQGKGAVDTFDATVAEVANIQRKVLSGLTDPEARKQAMQVMEQRAGAAVQTMSRHAAGERLRWQVQTSESRAETSLIAAANDPTNAALFSNSLHAALTEADTQGQIHGWDAATTELQRKKYTDFAYERRYAAWAGQDPVSALAHFAQHGAAVTPLKREELRNRLFQSAAPLLADELNAGGGVGVVPSAPVEPGKPSASAPRGVRNNNPGNIVRTERPWQGEVLGNDPRYASFESPEAGIRAMARTLQTYSNEHKLNTVTGIISRWAPATENDTGAYIQAVSGALGVDARQALNLGDPATMTGLVKAIIKHENGKQPYTDEQITKGVAAASTSGAQPAALPAPVALREPSGPTGHALVDALPPQERQRVLDLARTRGAQAMAEARDQLRGRVQDAKAEYLSTGTATSPPGAAEFVRAFGQREGVRQYQEFQDVATLGRQVQLVRNLPRANVEQIIEQAKPVPGDGYADRLRNYETLVKAATQVQDARERDPVAYAASSGLYGIAPLKSVDPAALAAELPRRAAAAGRIAQDYGTPVSLLTVPEAKALAGHLKAQPVEGQKQLLAAVSSGVGSVDMLKRTMQTIAPDAPVIAMAGVYQARRLRMTDGRDVADLLLRGQAALNPDQKADGSGHQGGKTLVKLPEEKLMLSEWNATAGDAFKGREQAQDLFYQGAKAVYAALSAEAGDYSGVIDSKRWRGAIQLSTGGIQPHNGQRIVLPYGMAYNVFQDMAKIRIAEAAKARPPVAASLDELQRLPLANIGDGRYLLQRGAGFVVGKDGQPLVIDVNPREGSGLREASGVVR